MDIYINDNKVYYKHYKESILIKKLNAGLSQFYGKNVEINEFNLSYFEGDILALCFGFE